MPLLLIVCLLGFLCPGANAAFPSPERSGDFAARLRANDAPIGGRFTIRAFLLDTLDAALTLPGEGRVAALLFHEANGKDSFVVPGDLFVEDREGARWRRGFVPVGDERLPGLLPKEKERWALWWIPADRDSVVWTSALETKLWYGPGNCAFKPLLGDDLVEAKSLIPWDRLAEVALDAERLVTDLQFPPDPAAFDDPPRVLTRISPVYPRSARTYDYEGTVYVAAVIDTRGTVEDAYVVQSNAEHELNVSALVAVMDWTFIAGKKRGEWVSGEMMIPVTFTLSSRDK